MFIEHFVHDTTLRVSKRQQLRSYLLCEVSGSLRQEPFNMDMLAVYGELCYERSYLPGWKFCCNLLDLPMSERTAYYFKHRKRLGLPRR